MIVQQRNKFSLAEHPAKGGGGFVNTLINNLPFELHVPGYNYCGPGTKLEKRLKRGDVGINPLDEACKSHDIAYAQNSSLDHRHRADLELAAAAKKRWLESNSLPERLVALGVNKIMKYKVKRGLGMSLTKVITAARKAVKSHQQQHHVNGDGNNGVGKGQQRRRRARVKKISTRKLISAAIKAAKTSIKGNKNYVKKPRVIPLPKRGGFIPLIPILGALAAAGSLAGGVTTAAKNIYEMVNKKNTALPVSVGKGMYMAPYKQGMGLFLTPYQKN